MCEYILALYVEGNNKILLNKLNLAVKDFKKAIKKNKIKIKVDSLRKIKRENLDDINYIYFIGECENEPNFEIINDFAEKHNIKWALTANDMEELFIIYDETKEIFKGNLCRVYINVPEHEFDGFIQTTGRLKRLTESFLSEEEIEDLTKKTKELGRVDLKKDGFVVKTRLFTFLSDEYFYWNK